MIFQHTAEELVELQRKREAWYLNEVLPSLDYFEKTGLYRDVAEFMDLRPHEKILVDMGCGDGRLLEELAGVQGRTLIGLDINELALQRAARLLEGAGHNVNAYTDVSLTYEPSTKDISLYSTAAWNNHRFERGKINLLREDFRHCEVLTHLLKRDLPGWADVVTFINPGGLSQATFEGEEKLVEEFIKLKTQVYLQAVTLLERGGRLVTAERKVYVDEFPEELYLEELKEDWSKYYKIGRTEFLPTEEIHQKNITLELRPFLVGDKTVNAYPNIQNSEGLKEVIFVAELIKKKLKKQERRKIKELRNWKMPPSPASRAGP